jgi:hypothetical protein
LESVVSPIDPDYPFDGLESSLVAADWYFDDDSRDLALRRRLSRSEVDGSFEVPMLLDDLDNLLPYRDAESPHTVELSSDDRELRARVALALPSSFDFSYSLSDAMRDALEQIAREVVFGPTVLEVEYFHGADGSLQSPFRIRLEHAHLVAMRHGRWIRYVPARYSEARHHGLPFVAVTDDHVVVDLPRDMRRTLERAIRAFRSPGANTFVPVDMLTKLREATFDLADHERLVNSFLRAQTRDLGWDGRERLTRGMLEPYGAWRALQFARFKVRMRDVIFDALQRAVYLAGGRLNFQCELKLAHVPTLDDIEQGSTDLLDGCTSINDATRLAWGLRPV